MDPARSCSSPAARSASAATSRCDLAAHGWHVAVHYRALGAPRPTQTVAAVQAAGGARRSPSPPTWPTKRECAVAGAGGAGGLRPHRRRGQQRLAVRIRRRRRLQLRGHGAPLARQHRTGHRAGARAARAPGAAARGAVVNLLDQKLWNPNPDYLSYTLSKAALEAADYAAGAGAGAARARVRRGAGRHAAVGRDERRRVRRPRTA